MTNNTLASINDALGMPAPPRLHKSLQKIGMKRNQHPIWGVRMGGSDYAAHSSSGADEENRRLMYDEQIDLTSPTTTTHATPSEPINMHHGENLKVQNRKADRYTIERPRSDSAIFHPKNFSSVAAKERSPRVAWAPPTPSPKMLGHACVSIRKRPRHGSFPASSKPRKLADHHSTRTASLNPKKYKHTTSNSSGLVPAPLHQDYTAAPADAWLMPPQVGEGSNYQQFCTSTPNNFHDTSEISLAHTSHQVFTGAPYVDTPVSDYNVGQPPYGVQWSYSYPQVPVTPYSSGPDPNRHASTYAGVSAYQMPCDPYLCTPSLHHEACPLLIKALQPM